MRMRRILAIFAAAVCPAVVSAADTVRICSLDSPHPPFLYPDHDGTVQILIKSAAERAGVKIEILPMPAERCRQQVLQGLLDGAAVMAFNSYNSKFAEFPLADGRPDPAMSVGTTRAMVFRRKGSSVTWHDGQFEDLRQPVLIPSGTGYISHKLTTLKIPYDEGGKEVDQNFRKLIAGRGDAAIVTENDGLRLLADPAFAGKIEVLPEPFIVQDFYMTFSKQYFAAHRATAESLWKATSAVRKSREYQRAIKDIR